MNINLQNLYLKQTALNNIIFSKFNLKFENCIDEIILALNVELGEFCNELKCFKYWSIKPPSEEHVILEEYVDALHFIISLCLYFKTDESLVISHISLTDNNKIKTQYINKLFKLINSINLDKNNNFNNKVVKKILLLFFKIGFMCGFTYDAIQEAYNAKYKKNIDRQSNNY